jgi:hypothetical protein
MTQYQSRLKATTRAVAAALPNIDQSWVSSSTPRAYVPGQGVGGAAMVNGGHAASIMRRSVARNALLALRFQKRRQLRSASLGE